MPDDKLTIQKISSIIGNPPLASDIHQAISIALQQPSVHLTSKTGIWEVFDASLQAAVRDIESHPRGKLFKRLIEFGPLNPDQPRKKRTDGTTTLSDPECGECVEFIYSHMVNRFKGELAELLALQPCIELVQQLSREKRLPSSIQLFWGETVQERRKIASGWGGFAKGADGLIVEVKKNKLLILGAVEIKSMQRSPRTLLEQLSKHIARVNGGVRLDSNEWRPDQVTISQKANMHRIMVTPSNWKVSREYHFEEIEKSRKLILAEPTIPSSPSLVTELSSGVWNITLSWSREALEQAAYEMTFWYMSQVGARIYSKKALPQGWEGMSPEEAGYNAIKQMLYYMPLRYITPRHQRLAIRLYNVYSFGYALGADSKEMLWPEDFA